MTNLLAITSLSPVSDEVEIECRNQNPQKREIENKKICWKINYQTNIIANVWLKQVSDFWFNNALKYEAKYFLLNHEYPGTLCISLYLYCQMNTFKRQSAFKNNVWSVGEPFILHSVRSHLQNKIYHFVVCSLLCHSEIKIFHPEIRCRTGLGHHVINR